MSTRVEWDESRVGDESGFTAYFGERVYTSRLRRILWCIRKAVTR